MQPTKDLCVLLGSSWEIFCLLADEDGTDMRKRWRWLGNKEVRKGGTHSKPVEWKEWGRKWGRKERRQGDQRGRWKKEGKANILNASCVWVCSYSDLFPPSPRIQHLPSNNPDSFHVGPSFALGPSWVLILDTKPQKRQQSKTYILSILGHFVILFSFEWH